MSDKKSEGAIPVAIGRGRAARVTPEMERELCTCGHRARNHAALKYSCQAPGNHKGYCPCMRFLSAKEWPRNKSLSA